MRVVAALGGNALLRRGQPPHVSVQRSNVAVAAAAIAELAAGHDVIVTHGNGPQVGLLALQSMAEASAEPTPLDVLDAESEGLIGYLLDQALCNALPGREVATVLTQTLVDPGDPAFGAPSKPIGPVYGEADARRFAAEHGWSVARDGDGFRRVVASPAPCGIVEAGTIALLVDAGVLVVCAGGGGIPVASDDGVLRGVEAVVDKDLAAELLARQVGAAALLLLTDVPGVELDWRLPTARLLHRATPAHLRTHAFAAGSMGPRSRPPAASWRPPAVWPASARSGTPPRSCAANAARSSPATRTRHCEKTASTLIAPGRCSHVRRAHRPAGRRARDVQWGTNRPGG